MAAFLYLIAFSLLGVALALTSFRAQAGCKLSPPTSVLTELYRCTVRVGTVCIKVKKKLGMCWE